MPLPQQDEFGEFSKQNEYKKFRSQCRFRSKMNSEWPKGKINEL